MSHLPRLFPLLRGGPSRTLLSTRIWIWIGRRARGFGRSLGMGLLPSSGLCYETRAVDVVVHHTVEPAASFLKNQQRPEIFSSQVRNG